MRRLAAMYRHRAEGTHFVQVHLADIEGENVEEATSTASSCSVCNQQQQPPIAPPPRSHDPKCSDPVIPVTKLHTRPPLIKPHDSKAPPTGSHDPPIGSHDPENDTESNSSTPTTNTHPNPTGQELPHNEASVDEETEDDEPQGRLPTPELKKIPPARKIRHHLDRTTPCKGAILTSPPKEVHHGWNLGDDEEEDPLTGPTIPPGVTKILPRYRRDMTSHAPIYPSQTTHTVTHRQPNVTIRKKPRTSGRTKMQERNFHKTQTQVPSRKTTATTRKMGVTEDDNLECSFCGSPLHQPAHKSSRLQADNRPLAMHSIGSAQPTANVPRQPRKAQHQPLSGSLLSLSSCSVASEVLQRAQHRKETFWNQRGTTAT